MNVKSTIAAGALALGLALSAGAANATAPTTTYEVYNFSGTCSDCMGYGTGTISLENYTPGTPLSSDNFTSFTYSSNLIDYTIYTAYDLEGSIGAGPGSYDVFLYGEGYFNSANDVLLPFYFNSQTDGSWSTSQAAPADFGTKGVWNGSVAGGVPEPGVWALLIAGFVGIGAMLRVSRRRQAFEA